MKDVSLHDNQYKLTTGLTELQESQLIKFALSDPLVQKHTSDSRRFKDRQAYETWKKKDRKIYSLSDPHGNLSGIIWFGVSSPPDPALDEFKVTFAIRLYPPARGKGLAGEFSSLALEDYIEGEEFKQSNSKGIWLETSADNIAAVKTYNKLGFIQNTEPDENNKIVMTLTQ